MDNLPCATKYEVEGLTEPVYEHGYRLGWVKDGHYYLNNHLDIELKYHQPAADLYRVVGFEVVPRSIDYSRLNFNKENGVRFLFLSFHLIISLQFRFSNI